MNAASSIVSRPALSGLPSASHGTQSAFSALAAPAETPEVMPPATEQKSTHGYVGRNALISGNTHLRALCETTTSNLQAQASGQMSNKSGVSLHVQAQASADETV